MKLSYKDIALRPSYSEIKSRTEVKTSKKFLGRNFQSPAIPANMQCTIDFNLADYLADRDYFYILDRFYDYNEILEWMAMPRKTTSISVGVQDKDKEFIKKTKNFYIDYITIDVAHGHHILVKEMIEFIKKYSIAKIIAGNVGTYEGAADLVRWGADAIKVGLSMGKSCTTYNVTGVGTPMFSLVSDIRAFIGDHIPIIADGQVREIGDICKALVAGADMVMIGSEFARRKDSPAELIWSEDGPKKIFYGSASTDNGNEEFIEGGTIYLDSLEEYYLDYYRKIDEGLKSCASYAGVKDIKNLKKMEWAQISV